ncbi:MAG TPA: CpaF family protein, partial [Bacillota bacterium]|nr:CpaF family protein [Bacillota bacterium]
RGMLRRLESLFLASSGFPIEAVRGQIAEAIDIFVHLSRDSSGVRRITEIAELKGLEAGELLLNTLFRYSPETGLKRVGELLNTEKLGLYE